MKEKNNGENMTKYKSYRFIDGKTRWIIVDENGNIINKNPSKEELKDLEKEIYIRNIAPKSIHYNETNTCYRCREEGIITKLIPGRTCREKDKDGNETGEWICAKHWMRYHERYDPNSHSNLRKSIRNCRTGNQDPNHTNTKGNIVLEVVCKLYGYVNLNKKYDNHRTEIDCIDEKTGELHQVQGRSLTIIYTYITTDGEEICHEGWGFSGFEDEWYKKYETMICICKSNDEKIIERIYIFHSWEIRKRKSVSIYKNPMRGTPWYEKYRITDEETIKKVNEIWKNIIDGK